MLLAREQIEVELNSTTDNPLVDVANKKIHHGGNFQAASTTTPTEKTRLALERIGKLLFAQSTELLDSRLNNSLPPNLAADELSLSYTMKGVDINMAAYMSDLYYVANPVSNHVHSAEISNQAVNSLALTSVRATHTAIDLVSLICSVYLYCLCQALDLRAMNSRFLEKLMPEIKRSTEELFRENLYLDKMDALHRSIWSKVLATLSATTHRGSSDRFSFVAQPVQPFLIEAFRTSELPLQDLPQKNWLELTTTWTSQAALVMKNTFLTNRAEYLSNPDATSCLGSASKRMYKFIGNELKVPVHRGLVDHPSGKNDGKERYNRGTYISRIYQALRDETLVFPIMGCLEDAVEMERREERFVTKL